MLPHIRHRYISSSFALFLCSVFFVGAVRAQQRCPGLAMHNPPETHNIFSVEQEQDLGDIEAQLLEDSFQVVHNAAFNAHVSAINNRLLAPSAVSRANIRIILAHQNAIVVSRAFHDVLGVSSVEIETT